MTNKLFQSKKKKWLLLLLAFAAITLSIILGYLLLGKKPVSKSDLTCTSSAYQSVENSMSKEEVTTLLGEPKSKRVKDSPEQNFFSQGDNEPKISEGWIYNFSGGTNAEIYFDSSSHVNGKGCGQG